MYFRPNIIMLLHNRHVFDIGNAKHISRRSTCHYTLNPIESVRALFTVRACI